MQFKPLKSTSKDQTHINNKIIEYNAQCVPFTQSKPFIRLDYHFKDKDKITAGINAVLYCWQCLYIDVLWVDDSHRHQGLGSLLIDTVEKQAKLEGAYIAHLSTFDWQAKDFYIKKGYDVFGKIDDNPLQHTHYFMKKKLI